MIFLWLFTVSLISGGPVYAEGLAVLTSNEMNSSGIVSLGAVQEPFDCPHI